jgi:hypothetical protein
LGRDFNERIGEKGKKLGRWEKKIQRQGGECRGEDTDGMDRRKWVGGIERKETTRRRRVAGCRGKTVLDYGIVNEEAWERVEEFGIGEGVESDYFEIALSLRMRRGGQEKGWEIGIKLFIFYFLWNCCFMLKKI